MSGIGRVGTGGVGSVPEPEVNTTTAPAATPASGEAAAERTPSTAGTRGAADVWATIARGSGSRPVPAGVNLDASGARRAVALDNGGRFTSHPGTDATTPAAIGDGLYAAG